LDITDPIKMSKLFFLVALTFVILVSSVPANCGKAADKVLEVETEQLLGSDPCGGKVCEETCPCGKKIYFNLDNIIQNDPNAKKIYRKVCVLDNAKDEQQLFGDVSKEVNPNKRTSSRPFISSRPGTRSNLPTSTIFTEENMEKDHGFIYQQLKNSLFICGFNHIAKQDGFGAIYEFCKRKLRLTTNPGSSSRSAANQGKTRRVPYLPNFIVSFAAKLKDFAKICQKTPDWQNSFRASLDALLMEAEKETEIDTKHFKNNRKRKSQYHCIAQQTEILKNNFANLLLQDAVIHNRQFCSCKRLYKKGIVTKNDPRQKSHRKFSRVPQVAAIYPFTPFISSYNFECYKACHGIKVLDFIEFE
jgi:hypothetical protein